MGREVKEEKLGAWYLYTGCRWKDVDYIYRDELEEALENGPLTKLRLAFSREDPNNRVYVQDLLREDGAEIWELVERRKAKLFVCGGPAMGKGVREALIDTFSKHGGMGEAAAK